MAITTDRLTNLNCCGCKMPMALSASWVEQAQQIGHQLQMFWCPYCGIKQGWSTNEREDEEGRLKRQLARAEREAQLARERAEKALAEADHFRHSRDGMRGALNKVKKRVGNGTCPCCKRHFSNLHNHMATKHPYYQEPST